MRGHGKNKCYFNTEKRLLAALVRVLRRKRSLCIRTLDVSKEASLASSSFYIHHKNLVELIEINEQKILSAVSSETKRIMKNKNRSLESSYRNILLTLYRHREIISATIESKNIELPVKIIKRLKPLITENWTSYGRRTDSFIFYQCSSEIMAEIVFWRSERFSVDEIPRHAHNLAIMTKNAPKNFAPIYYKKDKRRTKPYN